MRKKIITSLLIFSLAVISCQNKSETTQVEDIKINNNQDLETLDYNESFVQDNQLPIEAINFIKNNFKNDSILNSVKENSELGEEFKVKLSNDIKIEFDKNGQWLEIKSEKSEHFINATFLHQNIKEYLGKNYPERKLIKIEKDPDFIEIKLDNNTELKFNNLGEFLEKEN